MNFQIKSRYLDPKPIRKEPVVAEPSKLSNTFGQRRVTPSGKPLISSSDSSRTSSPAMTRALASRTRQRTKEAERLTMSTDSLCEPKPPGPMKSSSSKSVPNNRPQYTPVPGRKNTPSRTDPVKMKSAESLPDKPTGKTRTLVGCPNRKVEVESSPSLKLKSIASTPSPSLRRNPPQQNTNRAAETKRAPLNRAATFRVGQKSSPPSRTNSTASTPSAKDSVTVKNKVNVNRDTKTNNIVGKSVINNNSLMNGKSNNVTAKSKVLTVGSRSSTFLKDEPTVLKKPDKVKD